MTLALPSGARQCPICAGAMAQVDAPDIFHCSACGFFRSEIPVRINDLASIDEDARERALRPIRLANFRQILDACGAALSPGARLLDVGCAHGWFLQAAQARGLSCIGIEPDRDMARRARAAGYEVIAGFFPDAMPDGALFDAITFNDVFEHLPDVQATARAVPKFLAPGGILVVNLPVADGLIFKLARLAAGVGLRGPLDRMWQRGLPSPHLSYFTAETLQRLFAAAGFTLVRRGRLTSVVLSGLYARIRYDRGIGPVKAAGLYVAACGVRVVSALFASDIQYFVFRYPTARLEPG